MHQYRIEICEYNEEGNNANPIPMATLYADTPEDARMLCANYQYEKQENGNRKYQVKLYILCYKMVAKDTYFAQYEA